MLLFLWFVMTFNGYRRSGKNDLSERHCSKQGIRAAGQSWDAKCGNRKTNMQEAVSRQAGRRMESVREADSCTKVLYNLADRTTLQRKRRILDAEHWSRSMDSHGLRAFLRLNESTQSDALAVESATYEVS